MVSSSLAPLPKTKNWDATFGQLKILSKRYMSNLTPSMSNFSIDLVTLRDITTSMASRTSGLGRGLEAKKTQQLTRQLLKRGAKGVEIKSLHV